VQPGGCPTDHDLPLADHQGDGSRPYGGRRGHRGVEVDATQQPAYPPLAVESVEHTSTDPGTGRHQRRERLTDRETRRDRVEREGHQWAVHLGIHRPTMDH
jgi:hypothetical protein